MAAYSWPGDGYRLGTSSSMNSRSTKDQGRREELPNSRSRPTDISNSRSTKDQGRREELPNSTSRPTTSPQATEHPQASVFHTVSSRIPDRLKNFWSSSRPSDQQKEGAAPPEGGHGLELMQTEPVRNQPQGRASQAAEVDSSEKVDFQCWILLPVVLVNLTVDNVHTSEKCPNRNSICCG